MPKKTLRISIPLLAIILIFTLGFTLIQPDTKEASYKNISTEQVLSLVGSDDVIFLDVREPKEYNAGHIPGCTLMPKNSGVFEEEYSKLPKDKKIIVYCHSGGRSARASKFLVEQGYIDITNVTDGFSDYQELAEAKIEKGSLESNQ